jgi:hypothetical protein
MQGPDAAKVPNRQIRASSSRMRQRGTFIDEALEQRVHGNAAPPCFVGKPGLGLVRNLDSHAPLGLGLPIAEVISFRSHFP